MMPRVCYILRMYFYSVSRAKHGIPGEGKGYTRKNITVSIYCCILMWKASPELPELGASSREEIGPVGSMYTNTLTGQDFS